MLGEVSSWAQLAFASSRHGVWPEPHPGEASGLDPPAEGVGTLESSGNGFGVLIPVSGIPTYQLLAM